MDPNPQRCHYLAPNVLEIGRSCNPVNLQTHTFDLSTADINQDTDRTAVHLDCNSSSLTERKKNDDSRQVFKGLLSMEGLCFGYTHTL